MRTARIRDGLWMALGIAILANSRPYEGLLLCVPVAVCLFWWVATKKRPAVSVLLRRAAAPGASDSWSPAMMAYYNYRVFGDALTLPYQVNRATYASAPVFLWQQPRPEPVYRHKVMRDFYSRREMGGFSVRADTPRVSAWDGARKLGIALFFFLRHRVVPPLIMLPRVFRDRRMRFLVVAGGRIRVGLSVNAWLFPHYLAPFTCGVYAILLQAMRHLRALASRGSSRGTGSGAHYPGCLPDAGRLRLFAEPLNFRIPRWPTMWYGTEPLGLRAPTFWLN